jgi:hypothetical protein
MPCEMKASSGTIHASTVAREGDRIMEPRVSLITLGVSDLVRAVAFYRDG